jgi:hypothetical protein
MNETLLILRRPSLCEEDVVEEVQMISQSCDFDEFMDGIKDLDYLQVIYLADKEATEAERLKYRSRTERLVPPEACDGYANALKGFIRYMRYGVKSPSMEDPLHEWIQAFREAALENDTEYAEGEWGKE